MWPLAKVCSLCAVITCPSAFNLGIELKYLILLAGPLNNATYAMWKWLEEHKSNLDFIADCLEPPVTEPHWTD